jgi:AraC-like DNA-binding protein
MKAIIPSVDTPCIPTSYSRVVATELNLQEKSLNELLLGTSLDGPHFTSDATLLSPRQQIQIMRNALRLSGDDGFGLRLGKRLTPPAHGALGFLANSSPDLLTAVDAFQEYLPTRMSFIRLDVSHNEQWLECHLKVDFEAEVSVYRSLIEAVSLSLLSTVEFILGRPLIEGQFQFRFPEPDYVDIYSDYMPCPVSFNKSESQLLIPLELCYTPNASADHDNYDLALKQCQAMLAQLPLEKNTTRHRVQAYMLSHPPGQFNEQMVADSLFITKRTLARRLDKERTSFRRLRDDLFASLASSYLRDTGLSVEAIAGLLGYHDSASFRRAFKRWFSTTPNQYRQDYLR